MYSLGNLNEDATAFIFIHVRAKLDIVEEIHAWQSVWSHFYVVVCLVFEEVLHLHNVGVLQTITPEIIQNMDLKWYCT
ncbi:hypothetical protein RRF57_007703 [Xylaria bambusicola]|uniref:Uncharacterized protein n=1 Tax=Xylaria bambusicola TaxID=326684 RepID=A0AAN7UQW6_9PEZI